MRDNSNIKSDNLETQILFLETLSYIQELTLLGVAEYETPKERVDHISVLLNIVRNKILKKEIGDYCPEIKE